MQKTPFKRFISILMAVILLASSTGFVVVEHSCQMRGITRSVWSGEESCKTACNAPVKPINPSQEGVTRLSKQPCCQETAQLTRADITATVQSAADQEVQLPVFINPIIRTLSVWFHGCSIVLPFFDQLPYHRPPALSVSRYIALLCIWLI